MTVVATSFRTVFLLPTPVFERKLLECYRQLICQREREP
jgi:hypothetical protein